MIDRRAFLVSLPAAGLSFGLARAQSARTGMFSGRSNHDTTGTAILDGRTLTLGDDFVLDRAPDPMVGLGRDGKWDPNTYMGELMQKRGRQVYTLPDGINAADYNEAYIWCRAADVPLGIAPLS